MGKGKEMWARYAAAEMSLAIAASERMDAQARLDKAESDVQAALAELDASRAAIVEAIDAADFTNQAMSWSGPVEEEVNFERWATNLGVVMSPASSESPATVAEQSGSEECNVLAAMGAEDSSAPEYAAAEVDQAAAADDSYFPGLDPDLVDEHVESQVDSWADEFCVGDQLPGRSAAPAEPVMATVGPVDVDATGRAATPERHDAAVPLVGSAGPRPKKQPAQLSTRIAEYLRTAGPDGETLSGISVVMSDVEARHLDAALSALVSENLVVGCAGGRWVTRRWWLIGQVEEVMGDYDSVGAGRATVVQALLARCSSVRLTHIEANDVINAASKLGIVVGDRLLRRPRPYTLTPETRQKIAAGIEAGRSLNSIAVEFGVSWSTVDRVAKNPPTAPAPTKKSRRVA